MGMERLKGKEERKRNVRNETTCYRDKKANKQQIGISYTKRYLKMTCIQQHSKQQLTKTDTKISLTYKIVRLPFLKIRPPGKWREPLK